MNYNKRSSATPLIIAIVISSMAMFAVAHICEDGQTDYPGWTCDVVSVPTTVNLVQSAADSNTDLDDDVFAGLPDDFMNDKTHIRIESDVITSLPSNLFPASRVSSVQIMALYTSKLTNDGLPETLFANFALLESITFHVTGTDLTAIPDALFNDLSMLGVLDLHFKAVTALPVFAGLDALKTLTVNADAMTSFPAAFFTALTALETLTIHSESLSSIENTAFDTLTSLKTLTINAQTMTELRVADEVSTRFLADDFTLNLGDNIVLKHLDGSNVDMGTTTTTTTTVAPNGNSTTTAAPGSDDDAHSSHDDESSAAQLKVMGGVMMAVMAGTIHFF